MMYLSRGSYTRIPTILIHIYIGIIIIIMIIITMSIMMLTVLDAFRHLDQQARQQFVSVRKNWFRRLVGLSFGLFLSPGGH